MVAKTTWKRLHAELIPIPARSSNINPIEKIIFFTIVERKLNDDAVRLKISQQSYIEFSHHVKKTILDVPAEVVDKIINSMPKRMQLIIKHKAERLKY